tara:strand:+ start:118 stop:336 length:219 start_codon:yes stop_codon:yes gene_type:complete
MEIGNLVKAEYSEAIGIVIDIVQKKVWRTNEQGKAVNWNRVEPEPHAVVLYAHNNGTVNIPVVDLEVVDENR